MAPRCERGAFCLPGPAPRPTLPAGWRPATARGPGRRLAGCVIHPCRSRRPRKVRAGVRSGAAASLGSPGAGRRGCRRATAGAKRLSGASQVRRRSLGGRGGNVQPMPTCETTSTVPPCNGTRLCAIVRPVSRPRPLPWPHCATVRHPRVPHPRGRSVRRYGARLRSECPGHVSARATAMALRSRGAHQRSEAAWPVLRVGSGGALALGAPRVVPSAQSGGRCPADGRHAPHGRFRVGRHRRHPFGRHRGGEAGDQRQLAVRTPRGPEVETDPDSERPRLALGQRHFAVGRQEAEHFGYRAHVLTMAQRPGGRQGAAGGGAEWICNRAQTFCEVPGVEVIAMVDRWHAWRYVWKAGNTVFGDGTAAPACAEPLCTALRGGRSDHGRRRGLRHRPRWDARACPHGGRGGRVSGAPS